jgi:glutamine amidotransferase
MSFNEPVKPTLSFRGFRHKGENNPHGWGISFYLDKSAKVIKEPIKATVSDKAEEFTKKDLKINSKIFISHVRYASIGSKKIHNTHPFKRELNGKEFVFAHNGTLHYYTDLETGRFETDGETDSEHAFCHILHRIEDKAIQKWTQEDFSWLWKVLKNINKYGYFNCIFSDGEHLFCYHDNNGHNGLCYVQRISPFSAVRLIDEDFEINLAEEKRPSQKGFVIATEPLTNETWKDFAKGQLIVFKNGDIIFSKS